MNLFEAMIRGGIVMWPLFACSVLALAIIFERIWYFTRVSHVDVDEMLPRIIRYIKENRFAEALSVCDLKKTPLTAVIRTAIVNRERSREHLKEAVEETSLLEVPRLERHLNQLATVAHISPLLGLLGTVTGIIRCFYIIQEKAASSGAVNPADLAGGIMEALYTTAFGLLVAIPAFIAYNYLVAKVNSRVIEMERAAVDVISALK
jgi:biopolymer transport protein ExbB